MTTTNSEVHGAPASQPQDQKKRKPDYTDEAWTGRGRYLRIARWDEEVALDNGGSFLSHRTRVTAGYVDDGEYHDGEPIWLQGGQALRLAAMLQALDADEIAAQKEFRQSRKVQSN